MSFERKVAVITGASRGIGASLVEGFRKLGYGVIANSRTIGKADLIHDPQTLLVEGDIASPQTADRIVSTALERFGRIDTLVNNAGVFIPKPFVDYSEADFAAMINVNLAGFFHISQRVISEMLRTGSGHIVNVTATIAEQPTTSLPAALASLTKVGLNGVTRALALEYASRGIRVNAVSPGATRTPMHAPEMHGFLAGDGPHGGCARGRRGSAVSGKGRFRHGRDSARRWRRFGRPMAGGKSCGPIGD
jgi:NAD(P)-dependent dehydrogenase (short-subunit alcohol dehydrogenase family)